MSRIGKLPIQIPSGVTITVDSGNVTVKGPKGELTQFITPDVTVKVEDGNLTVARRDDSKPAKSQHGLMRALINNITVTGVTKGFRKNSKSTASGSASVWQGLTSN